MSESIQRHESAVSHEADSIDQMPGVTAEFIRGQLVELGTALEAALAQLSHEFTLDQVRACLAKLKTAWLVLSALARLMPEAGPDVE